MGAGRTREGIQEGLMKPRKVYKTRSGPQIKPRGAAKSRAKTSKRKQVPHIYPSEPLTNQRHEKFCHHVAKGDSDLAAYEKAFKCSRDCALTNAWTLREKQGVVARIRFLHKQAEGETLMTMKERRNFLARTVRAHMDGFDMIRDGDLVQEITRDKTDFGETVKIKLSDKRACVMDDAKLAGELIDKTDLTTKGQAIPIIQFMEPKVFRQRRGKE